MKVEIELSEMPADIALGEGAPELWLRVQSTDILDLPRVLRHLDDEQRAIFAEYNTRPARYFPGSAVHDEGVEPWASFEDWWTFKKTGA